MNEEIRKAFIKWQDKAGLSPLEFMKITGLGRSTTYKMLQSGEIPSVRLGPRRLLIPVRVVEEMLNQAWTKE